MRVGQFATQPAALGIVAAFTVAWFVLYPTSFGWGSIMISAAWITALFLARVIPVKTLRLYAAALRSKRR
jgi:hypothetical protein